MYLGLPTTFAQSFGSIFNSVFTKFNDLKGLAMLGAVGFGSCLCSRCCGTGLVKGGNAIISAESHEVVVISPRPKAQNDTTQWQQDHEVVATSSPPKAQNDTTSWQQDHEGIAISSPPNCNKAMKQL